MLDSVFADLASSALKIQSITAVAGDLTIARRIWSTYPPGHPQIEAAVQKLSASFIALCQDSTRLQLAVTRDGLLLDDDYLDRDNRAVKNVAAMLFERGIGVLEVQRAPELGELHALLSLLVMKREEVFSQGGIEQLWHEAGISSLQIKAIRYDRFSGTELERLDKDLAEETDNLWERFTRLLVKSELGLGDVEQGAFAPELLAARLNAHFFHRSGVGSGLSAATLRTFSSLVQQSFNATAGAGLGGDGSGTAAAGEGGDQDAGAERPDQKADLRAFITALDPELRRQILNGFCETAQLDADVSQELFRFLGSTLLQETYATAEQYAAAPPLLQELLRTLLPHLTKSFQAAGDDDEVRAKMQTLLQEHACEAYMPDGYIQGLVDALQSGSVKQLAPDELQPLLQTLTPHFIDSRSSDLILQLVFSDPTGATAQELIRNLADMCGHFLELGDYAHVLKVLSQAADPRLPPQLRLAMRDAFCRREFLDEILSGLTIWGKPKYDEVALLIQVLGRAFIEPLLDRMAEEENMSLRRFMMDRVQSFGEVARPHLLARLSDQRWYVLRNILIMLRSVATSDDAELLRPLLRNSNQRVRQESLRLLLYLGDPVAQRQLLRDIDSTDRETQLNAISMADRTSPPEMAHKLLTLLTAGGFSAVECELKSAAIQALGEIGRPELLPELVKVLGMRSLLSFKALQRIKLDVVRSFERYPVTAAGPLLEQLAKGGDELARQAAESLKKLRSKRP